MFLSKQDKDAKLADLAEIEGFPSVDELLEESITDAVSPAICTNSWCSYTAEMEPDQREGWCESCETNTVQAALVLAEVI